VTFAALWIARTHSLAEATLPRSPRGLATGQFDARGRAAHQRPFRLTVRRSNARAAYREVAVPWSAGTLFAYR